MINGVTQLFMMKVDILSELDSFKVCTDYTRNGDLTKEFSVDFNESWGTKYREFPSWKQHSFKNYEEFPIELKNYIEFIEKQINVPINLISTGPDRNQTITKH
jgi:adenylosuccinate synthase